MREGIPHIIKDAIGRNAYAIIIVDVNNLLGSFSDRPNFIYFVGSLLGFFDCTCNFFYLVDLVNIPL